jgi:antitoxin component of MazEF toxin-antitoxin module
MATQVVRTNNEVGVEIPSELAEQASLSVGKPVELISNGKGGLLLVKSSDRAKARKRKTIHEIVDGIPEGAVTGEYDSGAPQGFERMATNVVQTGNRPTVEASGRAPAVPFREITIEELLEGVEEGTSLGEYDWGPPRGAEFW